MIRGLSARNRTRTAAGVPARAPRATSPGPFGRIQKKIVEVIKVLHIKSLTSLLNNDMIVELQHAREECALFRCALQEAEKEA